MKLLGMLLVTVCLVLGAVAATTAYLPVVGDDLAGLTLNADANYIGADGELVVVAKKDAELTAAHITTLKANNVHRVRVKEFKFSRWTHWYWFVGAAVGLIVGGLIVKLEIKRAAKAAPTSEDTLTPEAAMQAMASSLSELRGELADIESESARLSEVVHRVGKMQRDLVYVIVEAKARLIAQLGMGGFARFMDTFSSAERMLNRAWSAAADGAHDEAMECLDLAEAPLREAGAKLGVMV